MKQNNQKEMESVILELDNLNATFKEAEEDYKRKKEFLSNKIRKFFKIQNIDSYNFLAKAGRYKEENKNLKIIDVCPQKITFDADKLEERLGKEVCKKIIKKEYKINDFEKLVGYLKSCGVDPKKFKAFIDVEKTVDNKKIDQLSDVGEIKFEDIMGCFTVKQTASYIKISEVKDETGEGE